MPPLLPPPRQGLLSRVLFGAAAAPAEDELHEFRVRFLIVLILAGAVLTGIFVVAMMGELNHVGWTHFRSMCLFTTTSIALWLVLRGHPERFRAVAWTYEAVCALEYISALVYVPTDELRILWFFTNVPGVFILLGPRAGWIITALTVNGLLIGNAHLSKPYSPNALATGVLCQLYLGAFFHAFVDRAVSYFHRMRALNGQLEQLASRDPLTGAMNARAYSAACDRFILTSARSGSPFSVLFVDLDHFKAINDTYGHEAGDEVLRCVARVLEANVRASDLVGRIGGEEFSVFLPDTPLAGALEVAEVLRASIEGAHPRAGEVVLRVTASIGVAASSIEVPAMKLLQKRADEAMYAAKKAGRNRVATLDIA